MSILLSSCGTPAAGTQTTSANAQSSSALTYVAIGASDTFGFGTNDPYADNWPTDLASKLGDNVHLINLGIPSIHVHQALGLELPIALDAHPNVVTVWLAVNDLADRVPVASYRHDLDTLLKRLRAGAPHAQIAIANVPDLSLVPHFSTQDPALLHQQIQDYNSAIAAVAHSHGAVLVDLVSQGYDLSQHPEYISSDGLHPSIIGYVRLAELFYQALHPNQ